MNVISSSYLCACITTSFPITCYKSCSGIYANYSKDPLKLKKQVLTLNIFLPYLLIRISKGLIKNVYLASLLLLLFCFCKPSLEM